MTGELRLNENGRWEIVDEFGNRIELTSGTRIDVAVSFYWIRTRIELKHGQYIASEQGVRLYEGQPAREVSNIFGP